MQLYGCSYNYVTKSTMMLQGYIIKSKNITLLKIRYLIFYAIDFIFTFIKLIFMYIIIQSSFSFKINNDIMFRNIKGYYG